MSKGSPSALAAWYALDVAGSIAADRPGRPVLVSDGRKIVRWPTGVAVMAGMPVVELIAQSDGVVVVSTLRRAARVIEATFVAYPTRSGLGFAPDPSAILLPDWRGGLASVADLALALLPAPGRLASP